MGINFAYARKKFSEAQQKLRKEYKAAGMTDEQILEMYEYDLHQFNRDLAYQRHTQRLGILEEPDMEEEGHNPLLHKFIDALTVYQQPTEDAKLWWLDEIEDADLIKSLGSPSAQFRRAASPGPSPPSSRMRQIPLLCSYANAENQTGLFLKRT